MKNKLVFTILATMMAFGIASPQAIALDLGKPFRKIGHWIPHQLLGDTGKNANAAAGAARTAADQTTQTVKKAEESLATLTPAAHAALWSIFGVMVILGMFLAAKTFAAWKVALAKPSPKPADAGVGTLSPC